MTSINDHHQDGTNEIIAETNDSSDNIVVASRSRQLNLTSSTNCSSRTGPGGGGVNTNSELSSSQKQQQNQHHILLPLPHREHAREPAGYNTMKKTVYKRRKHRTSSSNDGSKCKPISIDISSNNNANTNTLSRMEETLKGIVAGKKHRSHQQHRHHDSVSFAISPKKSMHKRSNNKKRIRSNRSSGTASPNPRGRKCIRERNSGRAGNFSGSGTDDDYGTEDGYAGSVSSNDTSARSQPGSTSPSPSASSSSEECELTGGDRQKAMPHRDKPKRTSSSSSSATSSSDLADFSSSGNSETMDEEDVTSSSPSPSPSLSAASSNYEDSDGLEKSFLSAKRNADAEHERIFKNFTRRRKSRKTVPTEVVEKPVALCSSRNKKVRAAVVKKNVYSGRPPILTLGCDVMANILTYLEPPNILDILTMPLSTVWQQSFTSQPELWRVLCLVEPFKATMDDPSDDPVYSSNSSDEETYYSIKARKDTAKQLLDKYRLLYTSFVRCMKYTSQIRDDAINGRPPAYIDYGISGTAGGSATSNTNPLNNVDRTSSTGSPPQPSTAVGSNKNLQMFLAQERDVVIEKSTNDTGNTDDETKDGNNSHSSKSGRIFPRLSTAARVATAVRKVSQYKTELNENELCEVILKIDF